MPKAPASPEQIETIKENIIQEAVSLINEIGFSNFSMRKLGTHLGIAAKTIYNYFSDKDELYLKVLTKGFEMLHLTMEETVTQDMSPFEVLRAMAHGYVRFGLENSHHYTILFSMDVPKYRDYVGTNHEKLAESQNRSALEVAVATRKAILKAVRINKQIKDEDLDYLLMQVWSTLHGIVSLYSSRVTLEVGAFEHVIPRMVDDAIAVFK